jgi:hypothetical protein
VFKAFFLASSWPRVVIVEWPRRTLMWILLRFAPLEGLFSVEANRIHCTRFLIKHAEERVMSIKCIPEVQIKAAGLGGHYFSLSPSLGESKPILLLGGLIWIYLLQFARKPKKLLLRLLRFPLCFCLFAESRNLNTRKHDSIVLHQA